MTSPAQGHQRGEGELLKFPLCPKCSKPMVHHGTHIASGLPAFCCPGCDYDQVGIDPTACPNCGFPQERPTPPPSAVELVRPKRETRASEKFPDDTGSTMDQWLKYAYALESYATAKESQVAALMERCKALEEVLNEMSCTCPNPDGSYPCLGNKNMECNSIKAKAALAKKEPADADR